MLKKELDFEMAERRTRGRPKMTWTRQVEELIEIKNVNAIDRRGAMLCMNFRGT